MEKGSRNFYSFCAVLIVVLVIGGAQGFAAEIRDILFQNQGAAEVVTIIADHDVTLTSWVAADPDRIILEGIRLDPGLFTSEILVDGAMVARLIPSTNHTPDGQVTRLELLLQSPATHQVQNLGDKVAVTINPVHQNHDGTEVALANEVLPGDFALAMEPTLAEERELVTPASIVLEAAAPVVIAQVDSRVVTPDTAAVSGGTVVTAMDAQNVLGMEEPKKYVGKAISLDFKDIDVIDVFRLIAEVSGFNVVIDPDVKGTITIRLDNVPWDQALDVILRNQGLDKEIEGNVMRIAHMAKLRDERVLKRQMEEAKERIRERVTRIVYLSYATAGEVANLSKKLLSGRGDIMVDGRTNSLIIIDIPETIDEIIKLVKILDVRTKQVFVNAQIVTTSKDFARNLGIQWGGRFVADAAHGNTTGYRFPYDYEVGLDRGEEDGYAINFPGGDQILDLTFGNVLDTLELRVALSALESEGMTKIISNPRITTADNETATVESGVQLPYTSVSAEGTQTNFVNATLRLEVTPHITHEGFISMLINVAKDSPDYSNRTAAGVPILTNRANTKVLVKDGDTLVIGGLNESTFGDTQNRLPFISKIPVLGWLFKNSLKNNKFTDLLIFITPQVMQWGEQVPVTGRL